MMTLRDLVLTMNGDEKLYIIPVVAEMIETTPDEIINEREDLHQCTVSHIWASHLVYKALMIELE